MWRVIINRLIYGLGFCLIVWDIISIKGVLALTSWVYWCQVIGIILLEVAITSRVIEKLKKKSKESSDQKNHINNSSRTKFVDQCEICEKYFGGLVEVSSDERIFCKDCTYKYKDKIWRKHV